MRGPPRSGSLLHGRRESKAAQLRKRNDTVGAILSDGQEGGMSEGADGSFPTGGCNPAGETARGVSRGAVVRQGRRANGSRVWRRKGRREEPVAGGAAAGT